jgi:hypothetical protein
MSTIVEINGSDDNITVGVSSPEIDVEVKTAPEVHIVEIIVDEFAAQTAKDAAEEAKEATEGKTDKGGFPGTSQDLKDEIETLKLPAANGAYVTKVEFSMMPIALSGVVNDFPLEDGNHYLSFNNAATEFHTISVPVPFWLYSGRPLFIKNNQATDLIIKHEGTGAGTYKFHFPNAQDFLLKPQEIIEFKLRFILSNAGYYEYVGSITDFSNYYEKAETDILLSNKLEVGDYNDRFKGVYLTELALNIAHPTADAGDYAQVNETGSTDVVNYNWDAEENIWVIGGSGGSGATNTDALPEGAINLYFKIARVLATVITGLSFAVGGTIVDGESLVVMLGKIQKQITDNVAAITSKQNTLVSGTNIKTVNGTTILGSGNLVTPDMDTTTSQTVSGTKTFLNSMFGFRNSANTFTSFFTNANTASRTYTLQNKSHTVADDADVLLRQKKAVSATGTVIDFTMPKIFNSPSSPSTSNLTDTLTGAEIGIIQKIYHNHSSVPTVPAGWVLIGSGVYEISVLNIIYAEWVSGTRVEYWIIQ